MRDQMAIRELLAELANMLKILERSVAFFQTFKDQYFPKLGQTTAAAMVVSQIFVDFYTCLETVFFCVSTRRLRIH